MDPEWLAVFGDRDYLFPADWLAYAWATNLAYPVVLLLLYRRRRALGAAVAGEAALVAGLIALIPIFLLSVPLTEQHLALAVQMQVNRVFWLLDGVVACYLAWWIMTDLGRRGSAAVRPAIVAVLLAAATARGYYVVHVEAARPLVEVGLPATAWTEAMTWLRTQPASWHVLADPQHVWRYGASVRLAAGRDTLVEADKDAAMAIYDRGVALRFAERRRALEGFDNFSATDVGALAAAYDLDVFVDRADRTFDLPVLYRNDHFVIYDLR